MTVSLRLEQVNIENPEDSILWEGGIGNAGFIVFVPSNTPVGPKNGSATVYAAGLQIARVHFVVNVGSGFSRHSALAAREERHRTAFASYASADRDEVLARTQGIQKASPALRVFLDVLSLRSGQDWERELREVIPQNDVFYLFWSGNARSSTWVEMEWRCALDVRGLDFIDPVPLVSPEEAPPPPELASKHFNDWTLAYIRGGRHCSAG